ncbi:MAG: prepilin peptidase [Deltaproteobacteria bacterium]|nr:prepilin peptidase [Deltaproteobacteria bacterium]
MTVEIAPGALLPIALVMGLLVGSFLNVVIHRVPLGLSVVFPPSHCPVCENPIEPWNNIPVLSYLWLRGRCRSCANPISLRYPAVELATGLLFLAIVWRFGETWWSVAYCVFAAALVVAAMIDHDHQIIPDRVSLGGLAVAMLVIPVLQAFYGLAYVEALVLSALGAFVGAGVLWAVAFLHARLSVALGRTFEHWPGEGEALPRPSEADYWLWFPGLGLGDVKLLGMIGAVLGPVGVLDTILASSLAGLLLGGAQALARGALGKPFGFAPAIAVGAVATLFLPPLFILSLVGRF